MTEQVRGRVRQGGPADPGWEKRLRQTAGLFYAVCRREFVIQLRYPVNTLGGLAGAYAFFLLIFFGGQAVGGPGFDDSLASIVVGYFIWTTATSAYQSLARGVTRESQWGTLERLYMSPVGFGRVMVMLAVAKVGFGVVWGVLTLVLVLVTTGESLAVDLVSVAPVLVFAVLSVLGVGFVFGGAALRFKRVEKVFDLVQFLFVGLVAAPVERYPLLKLLPLAHGSHLLRVIMVDGRPLWTVPTIDLLVLVAVGVAYFLAGYLVLERIVDWSRAVGVMGDY